MIGLSTGLRMAVIGNYGLGSMMNGGLFRLYGGTRPESPNLPPGTPELGRITTDGLEWEVGDPNEAGLVIELIPPGALISVGDWRLRGMAEGTATWFRWCWADEDPMEESDFFPRIDGDVGGPASGADLELPSMIILTTTNRHIDTFLFLLPMTGLVCTE